MLVCIVTLVALAGVIQFYVLKNWAALTETRASITKLNDQIRKLNARPVARKEDVAYRADVKSFVETQRGGDDHGRCLCLGCTRNQPVG